VVETYREELLMIKDEQIRILINAELKEANKKFPLFNSLHEGQSVLKEEIDETDDEFEDIKDLYRELWTATKENDLYGALEISHTILKRAEHVIRESIQVAAMAKKIIISERERMDSTYEELKKENESDRNEPADHAGK
jgi:hypothetical protein